MMALHDICQGPHALWLPAMRKVGKGFRREGLGILISGWGLEVGVLRGVKV